jgi:hypothetical protein
MGIWRLFVRKRLRMRCLQCSGWMYPVPRAKKDELERFLDATFEQRVGATHKHIRVRCESCRFEFMARPGVDL